VIFKAWNSVASFSPVPALIFRAEALHFQPLPAAAELPRRRSGRLREPSRRVREALVYSSRSLSPAYIDFDAASCSDTSSVSES
jgi:hypothetical protein